MQSSPWLTLTHTTHAQHSCHVSSLISARPQTARLPPEHLIAQDHPPAPPGQPLHLVLRELGVLNQPRTNDSLSNHDLLRRLRYGQSVPYYTGCPEPHLGIDLFRGIQCGSLGLRHKISGDRGRRTRSE